MAAKQDQSQPILSRRWLALVRQEQDLAGSLAPKLGELRLAIVGRICVMYRLRLPVGWELVICALLHICCLLVLGWQLLWPLVIALLLLPGRCAVSARHVRPLIGWLVVAFLPGWRQLLGLVQTLRLWHIARLLLQLLLLLHVLHGGLGVWLHELLPRLHGMLAGLQIDGLHVGSPGGRASRGLLRIVVHWPLVHLHIQGSMVSGPRLCVRQESANCRGRYGICSKDTEGHVRTFLQVGMQQGIHAHQGDVMAK